MSLLPALVFFVDNFFYFFIWYFVSGSLIPFFGFSADGVVTLTAGVLEAVATIDYTSGNTAIMKHIYVPFYFMLPILAVKNKHLCCLIV